MTDPTLTIERDAGTVKLTVNLGHIGTFDFKFDAGREWVAKLLVESVRDTIGATVERIRRDSYERGWRDAKAKRTKQTFWDPYFGARNG